MRKIVAEEVAPEDIDFSFYFDDDGLKSAGGENCAVYILGPGKGFNSEEYEEIQREAEEAGYDVGIESIRQFLTVKTGKQWAVESFYGYVQGDYCQVLYCPDNYKDGVTEIGKMWLGCGTEFVIDGVGGYFVVDTVRWDEGEKLINLLAEYAECDPSELEIHLYTGRHTVNEYKTLKGGSENEV